MVGFDLTEKKRCARCKKEQYVENFRLVGYGIDRKTCRFHSYCNACTRFLDRKRYADPLFAAIRRIKRKLRYQLTGK